MGIIPISGSMLGLATLATLGWQNILNYPRALQFGETNRRIGGVAPQMMQNFRGELFLLTGSDKGGNHLIALAIFATGILLISALWLKLYPALRKAIGIEAFGIVAAITVLISLIASPHTHIQEFLTACVSVIFLYPLLKMEQPSVLSRFLAVLLIGYPILSWIMYMLLPLFQMIKVEPYLFWDLSVLAITGLLVKRRLHQPTSSEA